MRRELLTWSFFILCLVHSACESTSNPNTGDYTPLKEQHDHLQLKDVYDLMNKSSRIGHQRMHEFRPLRLSQRARPANGGASDLSRTGPSKGAASSVLAKPPTFFLSAVFRHVAVGLIIFALY